MRTKPTAMASAPCPFIIRTTEKGKKSRKDEEKSKKKEEKANQKKEEKEERRRLEEERRKAEEDARAKKEWERKRTTTCVECVRQILRDTVREARSRFNDELQGKQCCQEAEHSCQHARLLHVITNVCACQQVVFRTYLVNRFESVADKECFQEVLQRADSFLAHMNIID